LKSFFSYSVFGAFDLIGAEPTKVCALMRAPPGVSVPALYVHIWSSNSQGIYYLKSQLQPQSRKVVTVIGTFENDEESLIKEGAIAMNFNLPHGGL